VLAAIGTPSSLSRDIMPLADPGYSLVHWMNTVVSGGLGR
jgi:hypothetical protein